MLYYLFEYLEKLNVPGARAFLYISTRSAAAVITSLLISILIGKKVIEILQKKQIGEVVRNLGLEGQYQKQGTPSMGGIIIIASILVPVLLFSKLDNVYILLMILTTIWLGVIGFIDDYIKIFKKHKEGMAGKFKIIAQVALGVIVAVTFYVSDDVVIRDSVSVNDLSASQRSEVIAENHGRIPTPGQEVILESKSTKTTIPFVKNNEFDYAWLVWFINKEHRAPWAWLLYIAMIVFLITAVSNGANLTDGLDGLATGTSAIIGIALGIFAYVSSNVIFADYLNIMYIPNIEELVVYAAAFIGATVGFLWYNSYPAQVFMGDTGSLTLGGIIAVFAIMVRKELLIPILCGIFLMESLSVIIQVSWFKHTQKKYGEGRRLFLMAPLHHHYQKKGFPEPKIVTRFWLVAIMLAVLSIVTLKIR